MLRAASSTEISDASAAAFTSSKVMWRSSPWRSFGSPQPQSRHMPSCSFLSRPCERSRSAGRLSVAPCSGEFSLGGLGLLAQLLGKRFDPLGHLLLLVQILLQELGSVPLAEIFRHLNETGVHHHLVVLSLLRAADVRHLQHLRRRILLVERLMLVRQPFHAEAGRLLRLFTNLLEDRFQILDVSLGLLFMLLQRLLELSVERFFLQLRQHLQDLLLGAHGIRQLMHE